MHERLNDFDILKVKEQAREKLGNCRKTNDIIGTQVFSILSLYARVIYYPLGENAPWGFTRISGSQNDSKLEKPFVAINTSIPLSCQVFATAHELYHIWYEQNPDFLPDNLLNEQENKINEKRANRFAAEFLIDEMMLRQEISTYKIRKINIKAVLQLADLFTVPYQVMVKRLYETGYIRDGEKEELLAISEESLSRYRKKYALSNKDADNRIAIDNLAELSINTFEAGLITFEKLEYLLDMCGLKPEDVGISKKNTNVFLSN